ncbi:XAC0095 family protein [Lysobacter antibioticus]|uniref:XAC0095 family protein n=1 Tax=Lysobacter antibioticus TaxID=84531 RepID=UPI003CCDEBDA
MSLAFSNPCHLVCSGYSSFGYPRCTCSVRLSKERCADMQSTNSVAHPTSCCYTLPTTAVQALTQTRDQLRLLAQLTEPQGEGCPDVIYLSAQALAHCFDRLADDLDRVAETVSPSGP